MTPTTPIPNFNLMPQGIDMATTTFTGESGANSFTAVNSVTPFNNYDAA